MFLLYQFNRLTKSNLTKKFIRQQVGACWQDYWSLAYGVFTLNQFDFKLNSTWLYFSLKVVPRILGYPIYSRKLILYVLYFANSTLRDVSTYGRERMLNRGMSFVEYWSTIWWIAFFETFDPQRRDWKYRSKRESKTSGNPRKR